MRKSLVLAILLLSAGATRVGADPGLTDISTWRWQLSAIQAQQKNLADQSVTIVAAARPLTAPQRFERFSPQGAVEAAKSTP